MKKNPVQTEATRRNLMNAIWALYRDKPFAKITIGEVARTAGYNRGTFYEYFTDIYDALDQMEEELLVDIRDDIRQVFHEELPDTVGEYSNMVVPVFKKYESRLFLLLGESGDPKFGPKLRSVFLSNFSDISHIPIEIPNRDYVIHFMYSGIVSLLQRWHENGMDLSDYELITLCQQLVATGIEGYLHLPIFRG